MGMRLNYEKYVKLLLEKKISETVKFPVKISLL